MMSSFSVRAHSAIAAQTSLVGDTIELDPRLTELLGLMVGDGCLMGEQETAMLTLAPEEAVVAARVQENLQSVQGRNCCRRSRIARMPAQLAPDDGADRHFVSLCRR